MIESICQFQDYLSDLSPKEKEDVYQPPAQYRQGVDR
jgi:hypothetical protein